MKTRFTKQVLIKEVQNVMKDFRLPFSSEDFVARDEIGGITVKVYCDPEYPMDSVAEQVNPLSQGAFWESEDVFVFWWDKEDLISFESEYFGESRKNTARRKIRVEESLDFDIRDNLMHDLYNAIGNVMFKYRNYDITEEEFDSILEEVSMRFWEDPGWN